MPCSTIRMMTSTREPSFGICRGGGGKKTGREQEVSKKKAQEHEDEYVLTFTNFIVQMRAYATPKMSDQTANVQVAFIIN